MKRIAFFMIVMVSLFAASSCTDGDFLGETQITDLDKERVFSDSTYTAGFLTQIYVDLGFDTHPTRFGQGGLQTACDEAEFRVSSSISTDVMFATGTVNPTTVSNDVWAICYRNIHRCNVFLANVDSSPMLESAKTVYKAEARFLRAWYYFILLRHYGGVPMLGDNIYTDKDEIPMKRATYADMVDYINKECELAAKDLPTRRGGRQFGRASASICYALQSRLHLYAASKLYNGVSSEITSDPEMVSLLGYAQADGERWKQAADAASRVISLGIYSMYAYHQNDQGTSEPGWGFYAQFQYHDFLQLNSFGGKDFANGANNGNILTFKHASGQEKERMFYSPTCGGSGDGGYIYHDLVELFPMKDGRPVGESKYEYDALNPNVNRDPRFHNSVIYDGSKCLNAGNDGYIVQTAKGYGATIDAIHEGTPTGYYIRKMTHRALAGNWFVGTSQNYLLIRYAEILLNYAEAVNEYYGPDHTDELGVVGTMSPYEALKQIREAAGIEAGEDGMYGLKAGMSQEEMREAIRLERRIELAFEGHRFFDVRRWMIASETDNAQMHGFEITKKASGARSGRVVNVRKHIFRPAMYYWPLPYNETIKSEDLVQNPNYD
jgi:hypothetical protein